MPVRAEIYWVPSLTSSFIQCSPLCSSQALAGNGTHPRASKKLQWRRSLPGFRQNEGDQ